VPDSEDLFPSDPTEWADHDLDGVGNNSDLDDDNDGMPDAWELQYGFNPLDASDAALDADTDGLTNLQEFQSDTIPVLQNWVGNWQFDNNGGTTASDSSASGNHGVLVGTPLWVEGLTGSALSFDGGDRVLVSDAPNLDVSTAMSLSVWVKPTRVAAQSVLNKGLTNVSDGYEISLSNSGVPFVRFNQVSSGNTYRLDGFSHYPADGQSWMHIAVSYDGITIRMYVNGVEEVSLDAPGLVIGQNDFPLAIGAQDDGTLPFSGVVDAVRLYDYGISVDEVIGLVSVGPGANSLPYYQRQSIGSMTASVDIGEKPQSKLWHYNNDFWMIVPDSSGTWVWRLDGTLWTKVLQLSVDPNTKSDVKLVSSSNGLVHVVIQSGDYMQLASLEYVAGSIPSYQVWNVRPYLVDLPLGLNSETVTLEIDSAGVMWVARDAGNRVEVLYSMSPYDDWSNVPVTLESGITSDDITAIVQIGSLGVGVMWSNQNTQRFGFAYHDNNDAPTIWSSTEYPGELNALNLGVGLADDHINLASSADGTVYAAVKTGYNDSNFVSLGLFVRSPAGVWGDLISIDKTDHATRPNVMLNEQDNTISFFYSDNSHGGSAVYAEASMSDLIFSPSRLLIGSSKFSDISSMKQGYTDKLVVLASERLRMQSTVVIESILLTR